MARIRKDDIVEVISGKDKGKKGKIIHCFPDDLVLVEGVNFVKKNMRRTQQDQKGGIIQKEAPLNVSNVMLVCKRCNRPVRVGFSYLKDGTKARICKKCKELL